MTGDPALLRVLNETPPLAGAMADALQEFRECSLEAPEEAHAVGAAISRLLPILRRNPDDPTLGRDLHALSSLFQNIETREAAVGLVEAAMEPLLAAVDILAGTPGSDENTILFALKQFAGYGWEPGVERIPELVRQSRFCDEYLWTVVFHALLQEGHPQQVWVAGRLRDPLPEGFARIAYLDFVNELCHRRVLAEHPFDTAPGFDILRRLILDADEDEFSYAVSATMALAFVNNAGRDDLLSIARDHAAFEVQMEAAWAEGFLQRPSGFEFLVRAARDASWSEQACDYLRLLDREDLIPEEATAPDFRAKAEMINWLRHPNEFGQAPDEIELVETRELYWPPTEDERTLYVYRYRYYGGSSSGDEASDEASAESQSEHPSTDEDGETVGYGVVGSVTFSLFGDYGDVQSAEDVLALHASWELDGKPDVARGRALLRFDSK